MDITDHVQEHFNLPISSSLVTPRRRTATGLMVAGTELVPFPTQIGVVFAIFGLRLIKSFHTELCGAYFTDMAIHSCLTAITIFGVSAERTLLLISLRATKIPW